jgi:carboxymethylenebutenolidase
MSHMLSLKASDGHALDAYLAQPQGAPKAGVVILQEIFGINPHIRSVADVYAKHGYLAIAPALFDRARKGVEYAYDATGMQEGYAIAKSLPVEGTLADIQAAVDYLLRQPGIRKVGVVGFCWGGKLAWLSNTRLHGVSATASYYPGGIQEFISEKSQCPAIFHFGSLDSHIPQSVIDKVQHEYPGFPVYTYEAGHAFNRDVDPNVYKKDIAALALQRTLAHLQEHLS